MRWVDYWDSDHPIYVNARHLAAHYRLLADDMLRLVPARSARVLDHGCGEALDAPRVAAKCSKLYLCEAAPSVRARLAARTGAIANIAVVAPEALETLPDGALDLVIANSIAQYLTVDELEGCLKLWHRLLAPGGRLVLADILPPRLGAVTDALALLRFAAREGFLVAAVFGLVRTIFSSYRKLRAQLGLTRYAEADIEERLRRAGFRPTRIANLGHNPARMAFSAVRG